MLGMLETERLRLRPPRAADAAFLLASREDAAVADFIVDKLPSLDAVRAWALSHGVPLQAEPGVWVQWLVLEHAGKPVGGLRFRWNEQTRWADIGYWVGPGHRRRGFATEAARAALGAAFVDLGAAKVWATAEPKNAASRRVIERCGLRFERREPHFRTPEGKLIELDYFGLLRVEWEGWRAGFGKA